MSATDAAAQPEGTGVIAWIAHRQRRMLLLVTSLLTVDMLMRLLGGEVADSFRWLGLATVGVWTMAVPISDRHYSRLCADCIASMPADGQARVTRYDRALRTRHWLLSTWRILGIIGALFLAQNGALWLTGPRTVPTILVGYLVSLALMVGHGWLVMTHRPLMPWCPYCRWGRDDDGPHECSPDLVPPSIKLDRTS